MSSLHKTPWNNPDFVSGWNETWGLDTPREQSAYLWIDENIGSFSGKSLIDIGCGNGNLISHFAHAAFHRWHGVDSGSEMIKTAIMNVPDQRVTFTHINPDEAFPFETTGTDYDVATALFVLGEIPHKDFSQFCLTIGDLLKEGGKALIFSNHPMNILNKNPMTIDDPQPDEPGLMEGYFDERPAKYTLSVLNQGRMIEAEGPHHHKTISAIVNTFAAAGLYLKNMLEIPPNTNFADMKERKPRWDDIPDLIGMAFEKRGP